MVKMDMPPPPHLLLGLHLLSIHHEHAHLKALLEDHAQGFAVKPAHRHVAHL